MKNRIIVLLTAWLICCAVQPFSVAIAEETRMDTYVLDQHGTVYFQPNADVRRGLAIGSDNPQSSQDEVLQYIHSVQK